MRTTLGIIVVAVLAGCGGSKPKQTPPPPPGGGGDNTQTTGGTDAAAPAPTPDKPAQASGKSLYDRLGGLPAITAVVDEFVNRTTADPRIKDRFFNTDPVNLKKLLTEFVCMATGGPCKYTGRDMTTSHGGMELVDDEFTALVENLIGALDKFKVPEKEKGELLGALGPLKPQIVTPADKLKPIDDKKLAAVTKLAGTMKDKEAAELLGLAVQAGKRGQRNYAEQIFTRVEMKVGAKTVAPIAATFRAGAPTRITTATKTLKDEGPQTQVPKAEEEPALPPKAKVGMLAGSLKIDGKSPSGLGVVMLTPAKGGGKKRVAKTRIIEQRGKEFAPHVMAIPVGSTVSFPNFDQIFHNVFSLSKSKAFDLGMYKNGETREMKFDKPGIIRLGCNLHAAMSAYLIVVAAPHYVVVDKDGKFSFKALAPGKYKVQVWNEFSGDPMDSEVEIKEGENSKDFDLKASPPGLSPDKFGTSRG
jgi:hemoglobin